MIYPFLIELTHLLNVGLGQIMLLKPFWKWDLDVMQIKYCLIFSIILLIYFLLGYFILGWYQQGFKALKRTREIRLYLIISSLMLKRLEKYDSESVVSRFHPYNLQIIWVIYFSWKNFQSKLLKFTYWKVNPEYRNTNVNSTLIPISTAYDGMTGYNILGFLHICPLYL